MLAAAECKLLVDRIAKLNMSDYCEKTRVLGLSSKTNCLMTGSAVSSVTDRRTDGEVNFDSVHRTMQIRVMRKKHVALANFLWPDVVVVYFAQSRRRLKEFLPCVSINGTTLILNVSVCLLVRHPLVL